MKYAITGPRGAIFRVLDSEPTDARHYVEITDEQAQTVADGEGRFFVIDGDLKTGEEVRSNLHWNPETGAWGPKPPPASITARQFFKVLAEDGNGEEKILAIATQAGFTATQTLDLKAELRASHFHRTNPMIGLLAPYLGYDTEEKVDDVFRRGESL